MIAVMYIMTRMVHAVVSIISVIPVIAIRELGIFLSFDVFFFFFVRGAKVFLWSSPEECVQNCRKGMRYTGFSWMRMCTQQIYLV